MFFIASPSITASLHCHCCFFLFSVLEYFQNFRNKNNGGGPPLLQCWRNINIERWWWSSCHLKPLTTNLAPLGEGQVLYLPIEVVESQPTKAHCEQIMGVICILTNGGLGRCSWWLDRDTSAALYPEEKINIDQPTVVENWYYIICVHYLE